MLLRRALWASLALALVGCPGFGDEYLTVDETPRFTADVQPILERWCTSCHTDPPTSGAPMPLLTHGQVVAFLEPVRVRTLVQQTMPPGGGMDPDDRAVLGAWIAAGAPDDTPDGGPPPDQGVGPTWAADIVPMIMEHGCAFDGCHGGATPQIGLDLSSYAGFVAGGNNGPVHGDGDPAASRFVDSLYGRNGIARMPLGGGVSPAQLATVEAWIQAGHPEQ